MEFGTACVAGFEASSQKTSSRKALLRENSSTKREIHKIWKAMEGWSLMFVLLIYVFSFWLWPTVYVSKVPFDTLVLETSSAKVHRFVFCQAFLILGTLEAQTW